jgi:thiol:disulfide interchange protein DsbD
MGLSLGIVAAPCAGPIVLSLFTYVGQLGDPFLGFLYFFILSIGMGLPLCVLAVFSGAIDKLPVSGDWMLWIKKIMGWILIGMAAYYIGPLITNPLIKSIVIILIIISAGVHLGWIDKTGRGKKKFLIIKKVIGVIIIISGFLYIITTASEKEVIEWRPYYNNVLIDAEQMKMPLIIDLYADWCLPCKEFEIKVFHDPEVIKLSKNFIMVRLDMTHEQPFHDEFRHQYKIPGVPTVLFFNSKGREVRELRVEYLVDRTDFLERMKKILEINDIEYKEVQ